MGARGGDKARSGAGPAPACELCGRPVVALGEHYGEQERMHGLCFHIAYEHRGDTDAPCDDPSCPLWHLEVLGGELGRLGRDPEEAIRQAIDARAREAGGG